MKIKVKLNESKTKLYEDDTLPPQSAPPKQGIVAKVKNFVRQFFDVLKAPFAKEMGIPEEEVQQHTMERLISKGATPHVQAIIDRLKAERDQRAQEVADYLDSLTVADLGDEQEPMFAPGEEDFRPPDQPQADELDPDDPFYDLLEVARRHFKQG